MLKVRFEELLQRDASGVHVEQMEGGVRAGPVNMSEMSPPQLRHLIASHSTFVFDCDGVLWKGMAAVEGSPNALGLLHELGKQIVFVTNNATKTRADCEKKARKLGFEFAKTTQFVTAGSATASTLSTLGIKKAYVVGAKGLHKELQDQGIATLGLEDRSKNVDDIDFKPNAVHELEAVGAVVSSFDGDVGYYKLAKAAAYIRYGGAWRGHGGTNTPKKEAADADPGVLFVAVSDFEVQDSFVFSAIDHRAHTTLLAWPLDTTMAMLNPYAKQTNPDQASPLGPGGLIPGGGAFLSFLETACGREHDLCCGKPSKALGDAIKRQFEIKDPSKDRLNTDVKFGNRAGFHSCAVLTGVSTPKDVAAAEGEEQPDFVSPCVGELLRAMTE